MARIHTHYDNLKVSRKAPQEVIRAAYKALSQKYHPDKNPGDEKAARIMAILNSAYGTLADPTRRREHDEWIAAEEWEIEWLESTRAEEGQRELLRHEPQWEPEQLAAPVAPWRNPKIWLSVGLGLVLGCVAGALLTSQMKALPMALAGKPEIRVAAAPVPAPAPPDSWAVSQPYVPESGSQAPQVKAMAVTQLVIPARKPDCDSELHALVAPNGEPWPAGSGYLDGFPVGNPGQDMQIVVDNSGNSSPVLVKVVDLDLRANVRHVYVLANERLTVDKLAAGKYEVRYQNIDVGGDPADCVQRRKREVKQAAVVQAEQAP
ncbi:MAG: J domain-containing protein [Pseudomonadota bacterium]